MLSKIFAFVLYAVLFLILLVIGIFLVSFVWWVIWDSIKKILFGLHYKKVAKYLDNPRIDLPFSSDGLISGNFKGRKIRWSIHLTLHERFLPSITLDFVLSKIDKVIPLFQKGYVNFTRLAQVTHKHKDAGSMFFSRNSSELCFEVDRLILKDKEILELLERLSSILEQFEDGNIDICFNCGEKIGVKPVTCPKCGWVWTGVTGLKSYS